MFSWTTGKQWRETPAIDHVKQLEASLKAFAKKAVKQGHQRILKRGRNIRHAPAEELHRLRIAGKRNRYAVEFFAPLYRPKRLRKYLDALSAMQDELGWRNDVSVGDRLLRQLETEKPDAATSAAFARGFLAAHVSGNERTLHKTWKRFRKADLPRLR
jgi:CHAD domain-containing protein